MSLIFTQIHDVSGISIKQHYPSNSNSITLDIQCGDDGSQGVEVTIFGLPAHVTDALIRALGAPKYTVRDSAAPVPEAAE